jgi:hypothetical protein
MKHVWDIALFLTMLKAKCSPRPFENGYKISIVFSPDVFHQSKTLGI